MEFKGRREMKHTKIEIIPMIDTMFFLLVFFILTSLGLVKVAGTNVKLPKASSSEKMSKPAELTVSVKKDGSVMVEKDTVPAGVDIGPALLKKVGNESKLRRASVVINADEDADHEDVVRAIEMARDAGVSKFAIATQPGQKKP